MVQCLFNSEALFNYNLIHIMVSFSKLLRRAAFFHNALLRLINQLHVLIVIALHFFCILCLTKVVTKHICKSHSIIRVFVFTGHIRLLISNFKTVCSSGTV